MTMVSHKMISASSFKAKCLALMDDVARTGECIVITKNGKPVAQLTPPPRRLGALRPAYGLHRGMVMPLDEVDLDAPVIDPSEWTADDSNVAG